MDIRGSRDSDAIHVSMDYVMTCTDIIGTALPEGSNFTFLFLISMFLLVDVVVAVDDQTPPVEHTPMSPALELCVPNVGGVVPRFAAGCAAECLLATFHPGYKHKTQFGKWVNIDVSLSNTKKDMQTCVYNKIHYTYFKYTYV